MKRAPRSTSVARPQLTHRDIVGGRALQALNQITEDARTCCTPDALCPKHARIQAQTEASRARHAWLNSRSQQASADVVAARKADYDAAIQTYLAAVQAERSN